MGIKETQEQLHNMFQQIGYRIEASKKYYALRDDLIKNGTDYSNELFRVIDEIVTGTEQQQFVKSISAGTILYRARGIDVEEYSKAENGLNIKIVNNEYVTEGFNEKNSIECPLGMGGVGRNNIAGTSYLYVAEDVATACAEIKSTIRSLISVAEFEVKSDLKIVNFSTDDKKFAYKQNDEYQMSLGRFITLLMMQYCQPVSNKDNYRATQIVSDYIRKMGYDGISYRSFFTIKNNYTIFNCHKNKIAYKNSRILAHQFSDDVFWDFNKQVAIHTENKSNKEYDSELANGILGDMQREFDKRRNAVENDAF